MFDEALWRQPLRTLIISKFVYGLGHITVMRGANAGIPTRRFLRLDLWATLFWFLIVGGLGYLSGASIELVKKYFHGAETVLLVGLVLLLAVQGVITYWVRKKKP